MTSSAWSKPPYILPRSSTTSEDYIKVTDDLGIPRNDAKDHEGEVAELLGIEHDTTTFEAPT